MLDLEASLAQLIDEILPIKTGMIKTEHDLARYQSIIDNTKPDVIVETGFAFGGSAKWFAERVPKVISVESNKEYLDAVTDLPDNVTTIHGFSSHVFDEVKRLINDDARVMVSLDSDHGCPVVYGEMVLYSQLVTKGCYMVVEDGIFHWYDKNWYQGDPYEAIEKFMAGPLGAEWQSDTELENAYTTSQHIGGWLRKSIG
jgi:cephalosporin hydroxylase